MNSASPINKPRLAVLSCMVAATALSRLLPHAPNFVPVAALAVFGVATFDNPRIGFAVPLLALLMSDYILGFYRALPVVYGSFALVATLGLLLRKRRSLPRTTLVTISGAILFFVLTNLGDWAVGDLVYPRTAAGLVACYVAAIPFFRSTLSSDLLYSLVLFGGLACAERLWPIIARRSLGVGAIPSA